MRLLITLFILFGIGFCPQVLGQNLIPNYSFEDTLPRIITPLYLPTEWTTANQGSPDYFSPFNPEVGVPGDSYSKGVPLNLVGHQYPVSGNAYMGILISEYSSVPLLREYLQATLKRPLKKDSTYCLQLYISLADSCQLASRNQFGIYLSQNRVNSNNIEVLNYTPQIHIQDIWGII